MVWTNGQEDYQSFNTISSNMYMQQLAATVYVYMLSNNFIKTAHKKPLHKESYQDTITIDGANLSRCVSHTVEGKTKTSVSASNHQTDAFAWRPLSHHCLLSCHWSCIQFHDQCEHGFWSNRSPLASWAYLSYIHWYARHEFNFKNECVSRYTLVSPEVVPLSICEGASWEWSHAFILDNDHSFWKWL